MYDSEVKSSLLALVLLAATAQEPSPVTRGISVDDLMRLRTIVDAKISPDGEQVAYVVSQPSVERNTHETGLFIVPAAGGSPRRLAATAQIFTPALPVPRLRWTPDGRRLSFLSSGNGRPQVFAVSADGGVPAAVTSAPAGVAAYEWSPDGGAIAYTVRDSVEALPVTRVGAASPPVRLWVQRLEGTAHAITPPEHYVDSFTWAPDSASLVYAAAPMVGFTAPYFTRLYHVSATSGVPELLVDRPGMNTSPVFAPDGKRVAFVSTSARVGLLAPRGLTIVMLEKAGRPVPATSIRSYPMNGAWIGEMVWAPDSKSMYVLMNEGTFATGRHMFEMPIVRVDVDSGHAEPLVSGPVVNYSVSVSRNGRTLAYRQVEARTMGDIVVRDVATGRSTTITNANPELAQFALGTLEPISWRTFDNKEIWGLLLKPYAAQQGRKLPLLVYCHGGPIGGVTYGVFPQFMHTVGQVDPYAVEAFAAAGYAVLFPMPRGGSGYGEEGHRSIIKAWGEADYRDIMAGVDHLVATGTADPERLGVLGASYGGFMTNWIVTQTNRFKAASSSASISDLTDLYYLSDSALVMDEYFGKPWENTSTYAAHSPITHAQRVQTPLLLQHGENDPRVPLVSGRRFYEALKALGKTVEFDVFPRGGHVQYQPAAQRASMQRNLDWFLNWIKP
jgi:dipeptidyl aminopeptidase/acylaminoacyl peptidase